MICFFFVHFQMKHGGETLQQILPALREMKNENIFVSVERFLINLVENDDNQNLDILYQSNTKYEEQIDFVSKKSIYNLIMDKECKDNTGNNDMIKIEDLCAIIQKWKEDISVDNAFFFVDLSMKSVDDFNEALFYFHDRNNRFEKNKSEKIYKFEPIISKITRLLLDPKHQNVKLEDRIQAIYKQSYKDMEALDFTNKNEFYLKLMKKSS
eukprot:43073_1